MTEGVVYKNKEKSKNVVEALWGLKVIADIVIKTLYQGARD